MSGREAQRSSGAEHIAPRSEANLKLPIKDRQMSVPVYWNIIVLRKLRMAFQVAVEQVINVDD